MTSRFVQRVRRPGALLFLVLLLTASASPLRAQVEATPAPQQHRTASVGERSTPIHAVPERREEVRDENWEYRHSAAVVKFGHWLGMSTDQAATAFTIFNFIALVAVVGYVLLKTLPKTFRSRSTEIQKRLVDARSATEEANARLNSVEARLTKLDEQIEGMRKGAEADSARDAVRIREGVEDSKAKILAAAEAEIQSATAAARRQIQEYAAELVIEQAARKLVVTAETDRLLIESFAHRLGADKAESN